MEKLTEAQKREIKRDFKGSVASIFEDYNNGWISCIGYTDKARDMLADFMAPQGAEIFDGTVVYEPEDYQFFDEMWREFISGEMFAE